MTGQSSTTFRIAVREVGSHPFGGPYFDTETWFFGNENNGYNYIADHTVVGYGTDYIDIFGFEIETANGEIFYPDDLTGLLIYNYPTNVANLVIGGADDGVIGLKNEIVTIKPGGAFILSGLLIPLSEETDDIIQIHNPTGEDAVYRLVVLTSGGVEPNGYVRLNSEDIPLKVMDETGHYGQLFGGTQ